MNLLSVLSDLLLWMIDALHLTIAKEIDIDMLATSDVVMAAGAKVMDFFVAQF